MTEQALQFALYRLLQPLVRLLLRHGVSFDEFSEIARRVYVEVADQDFQLEGRKQSISRISMLTGIQRKEVSRVRSRVQEPSLELERSHNRGVRIAGGWQRDPGFCDRRGRPLPLPLEGENSFAELVRRFSGDLPYRAVLDEFLRVGAVKLDDQGRAVLSNPAGYVPSESEQAQFTILGQSAADLLGTLDFNLQQENQDKRLQLSVAYNNVSRQTVDRFDALARRKGLKLLQEFDSWLAARDRDSNPGAEQKDSERCRVGVGIYLFEESMETEA